MSESLVTLSPEQTEVVESFGEGIAVMAGAGSGKTTTMVQKCLALLKRNPEARFIAVSFTERSASDLREKLTRHFLAMGDVSQIDRHRMTTIHGLCGSILKDYPRMGGLDGEERLLGAAEAGWLWEEVTEYLWSEDLSLELQKAWDLLLERESKFSLVALLRRVKELEPFGVLSALGDSPDPSAQSLALVSRELLARYARLKRRRGVLDFDDLEKIAAQILADPKIQQTYQNRFDLILVDEFQDTNPVQARLIWRLARPDQQNLCVVGDPKQSIYRFRDADVSVFEEYCKTLPRQFVLSKNFRSRPEILNFINDVCKKSFEVCEMAYESLLPTRPRGGESTDETTASVQAFQIASPEGLAEWVTSEVSRGVPLQEMVLLLRRVRGSEKWLKALTARGIPVAVGSGGLFWEDPRVREMVSFLKWWDQPANSLSGAVFLRAPWVGVKDEMLDQWIRKDATFVEPFFESDHFLARALKSLRHQSLRPGELLLKFLDFPEIEAELGAMLLQLWHRSEELSAQGFSFFAVTRELVKAMDEKRREPEVPPSQLHGQLLVLTIHGSKGLEFPHVILIDFPSKALRAPNSPLLFWDRKQGVYLGGRDEDGERMRTDSLEMQFRDLEKQKNLNESMRLFYVALTRARERLVLFFHGEKIEKGDEQAQKKEHSVYKADDWQGWVLSSGVGLTLKQIQLSLSVHRSSEIFSASQNISVPLSKPARLKRVRHSVTEWSLLVRCPRAYEWSFIRPVLVADGVGEAKLYSGLKVQTLKEEALDAKELGSAIHACLERGDFEGLRAIEEKVGKNRFQAEPFLSFALQSPWMAPANSKLGRKVWTELQFEVPFLGEVLVGAIDRLVYEQGQFKLIDFKVSSHAKSQRELFEAYQTQMSLYVEALGFLEPTSRGKTEAILIHLSPQGVSSHSVPTNKFSGQNQKFANASPLAELIHQSRQIIDDLKGVPRPSTLCRSCEFRPKCPEGSKFLGHIKQKLADLKETLLN